MLKPACVLTLLLTFLGIYGPLVARDPVLSRDDRSLLTPLTQVHSVSDYVRAWRAGRILDLQPVRDASFAVDLALGHLLGTGTSHGTNLLLWLVIVVLTWRLMRLEYGDTWAVLLGVLLFAVHPVFVGSVAWIAARKHLLACAFILGATLIFEDGRREKEFPAWRAAAIVVFYLAANLSQPIVVLWPLWAGLVLFLEGPVRAPRLTAAIVVCAGVMLVVAAANVLYYTGAYDQLSFTAKFSGDEAPATARLLALGRYFGDFLWPARLSTQYVPGRPIETFGLLASLLMAMALAVLAPWRSAVIWGALYFLTLAPMTLRMTNIYVSDTYALVSGVALLSLMLLLAQGIMSRWPRMKTPLAAVTVALTVIAAALSARQARSWLSDDALWAHAYEVEPSGRNAAMHASFLLRTGHREEAEALIRSIPRADWSGNLALVLGRALYESKLIPPDAKVQLLSSEPASPWRDYFLAALHAEAGRFDTAYALIRAALADHPRFGGDLPAVAAEGHYYCERSGGSDCDQFLTTARQKEGRWDEEKYRTRLAQLRGP